MGAFNPNDTDCTYPELKPEHTLRRNVDIKRRIGDSKRREGLLWTVGTASDHLAGVEPGDDLPVGLDQNFVPIPLVTLTRMTQRNSGMHSTDTLWGRGLTAIQVQQGLERRN